MLAFLIILIIVAGALEIISLRDPLSRVEYSVRVSRPSVDPDESFTVSSAVENRSLLPMPYILLSEYIPENMTVELPSGYSVQPASHALHGSKKLSCSAGLMPRQRLARSVSVSLPRRGRYFMRGADIYGGDFFGFSETVRNYRCFCEIVVLPRRAVDAPELSALGGFLGDISVRRFIMEDPVLTLSFREYTGREPQKQISWPESAKAGKLMVKEYDHTLESTATVALNIDCTGENREELIERCFSLARSVCEALESKRIKYSFFTNATAAGAIGCWSSVAEGLGSAHLYPILEGLGRATLEPHENFSRTVRRILKEAHQGGSHIIITPRTTRSVREAAAELSAVTGLAPLLICAGLSEREVS